MLKKWLPFFLVQFFAVAGLAYISPAAAAPADEEAVPVAEIAARTENQLRHAYEDKLMTATGIVYEVGPNMYGLPSIDLTDHEGGELLLMCVLPFRNYFSLLDIKKGQKLTVRGEYRGSIHGKPDGYAVLKQCEPLR